MVKINRLFVKAIHDNMFSIPIQKIDPDHLEWEEYSVGMIKGGKVIDNISEVLIGGDWGLEVTASDEEIRFIYGSNVYLCIMEYIEDHRVYTNISKLRDSELLEELKSIQVNGSDKKYIVGDIINGKPITRIQKLEESHYGFYRYYCCKDEQDSAIVKIIATDEQKFLAKSVIEIYENIEIKG